MIRYLLQYPDKLYFSLLEHVELVFITMFFSLLIAFVLTVFSVKYRVFGNVMMEIFSLIYAIPSLALFALLIPISGLGMTTAVIVLTIYNQYLLLRSFLNGIDNINPSIIEAAKGIGMKDWEILKLIQIPLAKKSIFASIKLAIISTVGIGVIASSINAGGLGDILFDGLRTLNTDKILWGSFLSASLAIGLNEILKCLEKYMEKTKV
ncbi:ABC transporter permease [Sharpea azabuensis]|uniref:ABC transporter permease n=1 Tax=Sharpea azabuensis TaxID=322505 RepID=UPI00240A2924|nr:ABC transporter permease [Sharpea azabuensis]MDD6513222.1 ABC transporter permease [Sharpea azabuensis]